MHNISRRKFIKSSIVALSASAVGAVNLNGDEKPNNEIKWDQEFDVLIVGSGLSANVAGIVAAEGGLKTVLLEKMSRAGGNSIISQLDFACVGSDIQKKEGIKDSVELFIKDLNNAGKGFNDVAQSRRIAENSKRAYEFMKARGVKYADKLKHLGGHSVARSLETIGGGGACLQTLNAHFETKGGSIFKRVKADEILKDTEGRVIGLKVREEYKFDKSLKDDDKENTSGVVKYYKANKAVIFASGGYSADKEFKFIQNPRLSLATTPSNPGATAGALKTMLKAKATPVQLSLARYSFGIPTEDLIFSIIVNGKTSKRFMNEDGDRQTLSNNILENMQNTDTTLFPVIIFDDTGFNQSHDINRLKNFLNLGKMKKFDTIEALANDFKLDVNVLKSEIERYNGFISKKSDDDFKKDFTKKMVSSIQKAPFYAILAAPGVSYTQGGVRVNLNFEVLDLQTNEPIKNLYAVGEATGGVHGFSRLTSCSVPDCITSAMIAGEFILKS
ncbi:flavocytochrome c [Campylobacter curvus]|uniref:Flavocytochrome c n=1 Tax=Campylobacter curvus (strain 525.92) TaxID=360105 RepID=A7GW86_CAMC5|nr:flavocytochrome c [Campylobacter curvus]EAU00612.1 flavocytochrome c [Campylobacter curvus 525.92]